MSFRNCGICYKKVFQKRTRERRQLSTFTFLDSQIELESSSLDNQLEVMFVLRKLLDVPENICSQLLNYGNPSSWFLCCDICCIFVEKAKGVFDQIAKLQHFLGEIKDELKSKIILTEKDLSDISAVGTMKPCETIGRPTSIVRSFVCKGSNNFEERSKVDDEEKLTDSDGHEEDSLSNESPVITQITSCPRKKTTDDNGPETFQTETIPDSKSERNRNSDVAESNRSQMPSLTPEVAIEFSEEDTSEMENTDVPADSALESEQCTQRPIDMDSDNIMQKNQLEINRESVKSDHLNTLEDIKKYECDACGTEFSNALSYTAHAKTHEPTESFLVYSKDKPQKITSSRKRKPPSGKRLGRPILHGGIRLVSTVIEGSTKKFWQCEDCDRSYKSRSIARSHRRMVHEDLKGIRRQCNICNVTFPFQNRTHHLQSKRHLKRMAEEGEKILMLKPFHCFNPI